MTCPVCHGTGDASGLCFYDCAAPGCTAADERTALDAAMALLPPMIKEDIHWAAYQAGVQMAEQRFAQERDELVRQLRAMWGYAIELDHDGEYFNRVDDEDTDRRDEWRTDTRAALALLQTYDSKK